ncbi:MAG: HlyC/CorC family transporter [Myxococcales bacterium]|nr:HlyC/CorC family transporter [Myxococcales bacterium]
MPDGLLGVLPWVVVGLCVLSEGFFAAAELSIISANAIRLEEAARRGSAAARRVLWFRQHPERLFGTTLLGTNLSTVTGSTMASLTLTQIDPSRGEWWAMLLMSPLVLIGGEIIPKSVGQSRADRTSQLLAGPLFVLHRILSPAIFFVRAYTGFLYRVLGIDDASRQAMASRDELALLMRTENSTGEMNADEREMISRIFAFSRLRARDSMVPLVEMVGVSTELTVAEAARVIADVGFSRLPVYRERIDDIVGILYHLDLLRAEQPDLPVSELMRPPFFVPETQEIDEILVLLQREAASAAIVVDEFGGAVGLLTLEDVLEEIVGEIHDEYDPQGRWWRAVPDGHLITARAPIGELNAHFKLGLPEDADYETVAGYMLDQLRRIPRVGEAVTLADGRRLTVRRANPRSIQEVHLSAAPRPRAPT